MAQFARPSSDITDGSWLNSAATPDNVDLYSYVDETSASDSDYIYCPPATLSTCELGLSTVTDPASSADHVLSYRMRRSKTNKTQACVFRLRQGTTTIASWTETNPSDTFTTVNRTLSGTEADNITDYSALRLQMEVTDAQAGGGNFEVSWAQLSVPDAGTEETGTPTDGLVFDDTAVGVGGELGLVTDAIEFDESGVVTTYELWSGDGLVFDDGVPVGSTSASETGTPTDDLVLDDTAVGVGGELGPVADGLSLDETPVAVSAILGPTTDGLSFDDTAVGEGSGAELVSDGLSLDDTTSELVAAPGPVTDGIVFDDTAVGDTSGAEVGSATEALEFGESGVVTTYELWSGDGLVLDDGVPAGDTSGQETATPSDDLVLDDTTVEVVSILGPVSDDLVFGESGAVTTYELWSGDGLAFDDAPVPSTGQTDATAFASDDLRFDEDMSTAVETEFDDEGLVFDDGVPVGDTSGQETATPSDGLVFGDTTVEVVSVLGTTAEGIVLDDTADGVGAAPGAATDDLVLSHGTPVGLAAALGPVSDGLVLDDTAVGETTGDEVGSATEVLEFGESGTVTTYELWGGDGLVFDDGIPVGDTVSDATGTPTDNLVFDEDFTTIEEVDFDDEGLVLSDSAAGDVSLAGAVSDGLVFDDAAEAVFGVTVASSDGLVFGSSVAETVSKLTEVLDAVVFYDAGDTDVFVEVSVSDGLSFNDVTLLLSDLSRRYSFSRLGEETRIHMAVVHRNKRYHIATVGSDERLSNGDVS